MTRNHVGFARACSNPAAHDFISYKNLFYIKNKRVVIGLEISNPTTHNIGLLYFLFSGRAGVVIGHDSKSCGLCPRRFESCRPRLILHKKFFYIKNKRVVIGLDTRILLLRTSAYSILYSVAVPEWLMGMTRNHVGFPVQVRILQLTNYILHKIFFTLKIVVVRRLKISNATNHNLGLFYFSFSGRARLVMRHD